MWIASAAFADDSAFGPRLVQEDIRIPAGNGRYSIAATILRPEGAGPYGAIVLNHGTPGSATGRAMVFRSPSARARPSRRPCCCIPRRRSRNVATPW
jgi:hypothetical protein